MAGGVVTVIPNQAGCLRSGPLLARDEISSCRRRLDRILEVCSGTKHAALATHLLTLILDFRSPHVSPVHDFQIAAMPRSSRAGVSDLYPWAMGQTRSRPGRIARRSFPTPAAARRLHCREETVGLLGQRLVLVQFIARAQPRVLVLAPIHWGNRAGEPRF